MADYQEVEDLLEAIERQQRVAKIEENIRLMLKEEQIKLLETKLLSLGPIVNPSSSTDIHAHTDKKLDILKEFLVYADENTVATDEEIEEFIFEGEIDEAGLWREYEAELQNREIIRAEMDDLRGELRSRVEAYLKHKFKLERKKEEMGENGITHCFYGRFMDEEGYWQFSFNEQGTLILYRELENQMKDLYRKRIDCMNRKVKMGAEKEQVEKDLLTELGYVPVGVPEKLHGDTIQKYGFLSRNKQIAACRIIYNRRDWVTKKELLPYEEV